MKSCKPEDYCCKYMPKCKPMQSCEYEYDCEPMPPMPMCEKRSVGTYTMKCRVYENPCGYEIHKVCPCCGHDYDMDQYCQCPMCGAPIDTASMDDPPQDDPPLYDRDRDDFGRRRRFARFGFFPFFPFFPFFFRGFRRF